jgi:hypothetical protein
MVQRIKNASLRKPAPLVIAKACLFGIYRSNRVWELVDMKKKRELQRDEFLREAASFRNRTIRVPLTHPLPSGITLQRAFTGEVLMIHTMVRASTFRHLYVETRKILGLQLRGSSISVCLRFISGRYEAGFRFEEEIPCGDNYIHSRLKGAVLQVVVHE